MENNILAESALVFDSVCFSYSGQEVLHSISFSVPKNSFTGVVGPNGGGKTTLLRLALGLVKPDKGTVSVLGKSPEEARPDIGYVMQHVQYDDKFPASVLDVVLMGRAGRRRIGFYSKTDKTAAVTALEQVEMESLLKRPFPNLSGGQRQRVLIAQALASNPAMLLLDEPTANIDTEGEAAVNALLGKLAARITIVMVSHNINTVLDCSTHVICINRTATMNPLSHMHPDLLARAKGGGIAVLHHELNCRVFEKDTGGACETVHEHPHRRAGD